MGRRRSTGRTRAATFATLAALALAALALLPAIASAYVYWTNTNLPAIGRANLDGSNPNQSFIPAALPRGVAVDAHHIYWGIYPNAIGRANLDGSNVNTSFITGASLPDGVAVDSDYIYWANSNSQAIGRADIDGSDPNQSFITGANAPQGVAVDADHIYWTNPGTDVTGGTLGRADIDGSDPNQSFITGATHPSDVVVDSLKPPNTKIKSASINRDKRKATFKFSSSLPDSSFRCKLDGKNYKRCKSPKTYKDLSKGKHTFRVKARNAQKDEDPSAAKKSFKI